MSGDLTIGVPKETFPCERRVAIDPATAKKLIGTGVSVVIQSGAGAEAGFRDADYVSQGARVVDSRDEVFRCTILAQVRGLGANQDQGRADLERYTPGQLAIGLWDPLGHPESIHEVAARGTRCVALEMIPRITRAQSMDVLSSMATLAGYRAVILAALELPKIFSLLMTAAGTLLPARVLVIGAGVAGLQAIATAKRLGAVVEAYDVRAVTREQIESVGGKFIDLKLDTADAEGAGGYAKALGEEFYQRQQAALAEYVAQSDVVITTAAIPGKPSPVLVTEDAVRRMRPGSVIVDLAAERGGNCPLCCADQRVVVHGVTILGPTNPASDIPQHASQMFARNIAEFIRLIVRKGELTIDEEDEIVRETIVSRDGKVTHPRLQDLT